MAKRWTTAISILTLAWAMPATAQVYGPVNADLPAGGDSYRTAIGGDGAAAIAGADWTLSAWIDVRAADTTALVAGFGDPPGARRFLALDHGRPAFVSDAGSVTGPARLAVGWHAVAVSYEGGTAHLFVDGRAVAQRRIAAAAVLPVATLAPRGSGTPFAILAKLQSLLSKLR